jgi:type II secretory pathway pseudopilin PulG
MVVVVTIIGLLAGISVPSAAAGIDAIRLVTATDSVASFINGAVNRVERRQQPLALVISRKDNSLSLYSTEPGFTRELKMPEGVRIEAVLPKIEEQEDVRRLVLMPGATVPGIGIQIANRRGSRRIVRLDPMTGFPHVESVNSE